MKSVSIVGLGWLGFPLARHLKSVGWVVKGSKRTHEGVEAMRLRRIDSYYLELLPELNCDPDDLHQLLSNTSLVINIPPSGYFFDPQKYVEGIQYLVNEALLHGVNHIIFISSISVYPQCSGEFDENSPIDTTSEVAKALVEIEQWLLQHSDIHCDILRLAGLVGVSRHPVHYLAGKSNLKEGNQPVNLVHLTDCILAIEALLDTPSHQRCYNLCAPLHPLRKPYYQEMAERFDLLIPHFDNTNPTAINRIIRADKICDELEFIYQYPDPYMMSLEEIH